MTRAALHRRLSLTLRLLLLAGAALPLSLGVVFAADNLFNLSASVRAVISLAFLVGLAGGLIRLYFLYWHRPIDAAKMAVYLEQRYGIADNSLINAVHFDRDPAIPGFIKEVFTHAAASTCTGLSFRVVWQHAHLKPALKLCAAGILLFLAYLIPFGLHAKNAFLRYLNPATAVTPLNFTQFSVSPGHAEVIEGSACLIRASAAKFNRPVGALDILVKEGAAPLLYPMRSEADGFVFEMSDLSHETRYAVKNGNDISRWYTVTVIRRPRLDALTVTVTPPAYTGGKPWQVSPQRREAEILKGSQIQVSTSPSRSQQVRFIRDGKEIVSAGTPPRRRPQDNGTGGGLRGTRPTRDDMAGTTDARSPAGTPPGDVRGAPGRDASPQASAAQPSGSHPGDLPLATGRDASPQASASLAFDLLASTAVSVDVKDARGLMHTGVWQCRFKMIPDKIPEVRFLNRELNVEVGAGQTLPLKIEESDDFGITVLELYTTQNQEEKLLKRISYREIKKDRNEASALEVSEDLFARNASYKVWARVFDNHEPPQSGIVLTPLTLHVVDLAKAMTAGDRDDPYVRLFTVLTEALEHEKELRNWVSVRVELDRKERISHVVHKRQQSVHERIVTGSTLAADLLLKKKIKKGLSDSISQLKTDQSDPLIRRIPVIAQLDDERRRAELNDIVLQQTSIVTALQKILGVISQDKSLDDLRKDQLAEEQQDQKLFDKLQKLKDDLAAFKDEQRKILEDTEAIDKKDPEDWTEAEEKLLGDLAAKEQNYAKFFQAAFNDLSKVENQDFSNSTMADELVEMIEELQKAGAALEKKHIEIATVNEELLGEQAESIETNLERWLADAKDNIKWNGEEGGVNPDVPLQDLPAELTDIIGELIDDVKDMEDVEDSSNSSLSSMDKGIGWGSGDGNMDDMSAKGITGNSMPNNNEVGGRSGEGRSGKSTGQFVEQEATGKGGRDTPTRLVQSPFEKGTVKDSSKDPQGGATGGGKQSGLGGDGLRGITPSRKPDVEQRLPGKQAELKQKAEALMRELNVRNLPTGDLEEAVNKMELIQKYRSTGQGLQVKQVASELVSSLKDARIAMKAGASGGSEKSGVKAQRISTIRHPDNESTPDGYEASVDAYFRALAVPDGE